LGNEAINVVKELAPVLQLNRDGYHFRFPSFSSGRGASKGRPNSPDFPKHQHRLLFLRNFSWRQETGAMPLPEPAPVSLVGSAADAQVCIYG
jgi:hypothetical protein